MATSTTKQESVDIQQLAIWTVVAALAAAVINAILFFVTQGQFETAEAMGQPFSVAPVILATVVQIFLGGILLAVLDRFVARPITIWMWIAIVVLVLSLAQPFMFLEGEFTTTTQLILVVMHIIAGGIAIYLLTTRTKAA